MSQQLPIPEPLWNTIPADAQAALLAAWKATKDRIAELEAVVRDLQARLRLNSTNSSKPPSSDPIGLKRRPPAPPSSRKRGGQPGHRKAFRALVPPEKLRSSTDCDRPLRFLRLDRRGELSGLLESSPPRFPGDDRS